MSDERQVDSSGAADLKSRLKNNVKRLREDRLLTKAELARKAGVSTLTIDRVEAGLPCRMDTKRKIILALGMTVAEKDKVFVREDDEDAAVVASGRQDRN
jgi:DNA-binding XRE family transcriptional regulator